MSLGVGEVGALLVGALGLSRSASEFTEDTPLLGAMPELDSMAVVNVITAIEEHYGVRVEDDEISAETFATVGTLRRFIAEKLA